jgi:hypothetical protein
MAINLDAIRRKMEQLNSKGGGGGSYSKLWRPKEIGEYKVRALPWPDGKTAEGVPFVERYFYWIGDTSLLAPKQFGEDDPINDVITALFRTKKEDDKETAKKLLPKMKAYLPIVVKGEEDKGVQVWAFARDTYLRLLGFFTNEEIGDFTNPQEGFDLIVTVSDSGKKWNGKPVLNQTIDAARRSSSFAKWFGDDDAKVDALLAKIPDIDAMNADYRKTPSQAKAILDRWLDSGRTDTKSEGTARGPASPDKLDQLAEEVSSGKAAEVAVTKAKAEKPAKGKKTTTVDDDVSTKVDADLDSALDELME